MAVNNLQFKVALRENKNRKSAGYGKFYVEKARTTTLSQRGFVEHLTEHGLSMPRSVIEAVLTQIAQCIPELCAKGVGVKLNSLGTFYPTVQSKGFDREDLTDGMDASQNIMGIHVRFRPDGTKLDDYTSRGFTRRASSTLEGVVEQKTIEGKKVRQITPLDVWLAEHEAPQP